MDKSVPQIISPLQVLSIAFGLLGIIIWYGVKRSSCRGPLVWPVLGHLPSLIYHVRHVSDWFTDLAIQNDGTFRLHGPWKTKIFTADPNNIEYLLTTKYHNFGKGDNFKQAFRDVLGDALLLEEGERFRELNKSISMAITSAAFRNTAAASFAAAVHQKLLPVLRNAAEKGATIDLQDVFHRFAFDNTCTLGFDYDPGSLRTDLPVVKFLDAFDGAMEASLLRIFMPALCWKTMRYFNLGSERRLREGREIVDGFLDDVFARSRIGDGSDIASVFLELERRSGRQHSEKMMRAFMLGLIMAGKDAVSVGLTWFFWILSRHPHVEAKIMAELRHIINRRDTPDNNDIDDPSPFSFQELKAMHYLHAALTESLRLFPPVPMHATEAKQDDILPDGTAVEKGAQLVYLIYSSARLKNVWGDDCSEYKPERWLKNGEFVRESDFKFLVFNGGPRRCTGRDFAYWEMKWASASILSRYRVKVAAKHPVSLKFTTVLKMKHGLPVAIHPRNGED